MTIQEQHVALPKLYGAPAYARPVPVVEASPRPLDPDDLPIEAFQTTDERVIALTLTGHAYAHGGAFLGGPGPIEAAASGGIPRLRPRPLSLRTLAGRVLQKADPWPRQS